MIRSVIELSQEIIDHYYQISIIRVIESLSRIMLQKIIFYRVKSGNY